MKSILGGPNVTRIAPKLVKKNLASFLIVYELQSSTKELTKGCVHLPPTVGSRNLGIIASRNSVHCMCFFNLHLFDTVSSTPLCTTSSWECVFPFIHEEYEYNFGCAQPSWEDALYGSKAWCPTVTDARGKYEGFRPFIAECRPHCRVVSDMALGGFHIWRPQNFRGFGPPPPLVTYRIHATSFLSSASWG